MNELAVRRQRHWPLVAGAVLLAMAAALAAGEWFGWPFLALPLQQFLADTLDRRVVISNSAEAGSPQKAFRVTFGGGLRLFAPQLEIGAPAWSPSPHLVLARDVALELRYTDLWRAHLGQPLRIQRLQASALDARLERLADGRASWQFGPQPRAAAMAAQPVRFPLIGDLQVAAGTLRYTDAPLAVDVEARLSLSNGAASSSRGPTSVLQVNATGRYRALPLQIELRASGALPWMADADGALAMPVPLSLNATVGQANLVFKGSASDALRLSGLSGRFSLKGPSLAAVGDPMGVTLPTTAAFRTSGFIVNQGNVWRVLIDDATVGASRLTGAFAYDRGRSVPLLSGRLGGARLLLSDLGPVVGTTPAVAASPAGSAASAASALPKSTRGQGRVLPDRPFDLPAMRAMDANVLIDIADVDLNTRLLEPLRPLRGHLQLVAGVLTLRELDARTAQGRLMGNLTLDGRRALALWTVDVRWDDVRLERWVRQARADAAPPFVSGRLQGSAKLQGQGRSTAEILASLKGRVHTELHNGAVSHFVVEAAGLDLAEGLGLIFKGDDALPVQCAVADLVADKGLFRPVVVVDTTDSAVWIDGSLSLATEALDLRAVVIPKDFSPLTLRTPLRVRGRFADPEVSVEKGPLGRKLATALLLALVNPLAALIPLIDPGRAEDAARSAAACQGLKQRSRSKAAPVPAAR